MRQLILLEGHEIASMKNGETLTIHAGNQTIMLGAVTRRKRTEVPHMKRPYTRRVLLKKGQKTNTPYICPVCQHESKTSQAHGGHVASHKSKKG